MCDVWLAKLFNRHETDVVPAEWMINNCNIQLSSTSPNHFGIVSCAYMKKKISVPIGPHCPCARPCALYLLLHYKNRAPWFPSESKAALRTTWAASASESKSRLSHSFYWSVRSSWIISELVGFRTDTELLLKHCLLSLMLTSIIYHPAGTSHFSRRLCTATEAG